MNYEEYLKTREVLAKENGNLVGNVLNKDEEKLDKLLSSYKQELRDVVDERHLYKMPVLRNEKFWTSKLWAFCKRLPKGSDLHVHGLALLPAWKLVDFVSTRPELVVDITDGHIYNVAEKYNKDNCYQLQEALDKKLINKKELETFWSLLGLKHEDNVWEYFEKICVLHDSLEYSNDTYYAYYIYAFNYYLENNIKHIEIHILFSDIYEKTAGYADALRRAYYDVKKNNPDFTVSIICASLKYKGIDLDVMRTYFDNALRLKSQFKDDFDPNNVHEWVVGFDLINEEDSSLSLKELAPMLFEYREKYPDLKYFIHCGESLQAQSDNLIDAYLLGATRVGHGMNLYRYPELLQKYVEKEICLESCLISNQSLRYVKDLRLHPSLEYLRRGVTIALCSDDPTYQEKESLCDDFFAGIACWDLNLADVKQLCINSILYSALDKQQKSELIKSWKNDWDKFVKEGIK